MDGIPFLVETWSGDGVRGMSAIFLTEHVAAMDDAALQKFLEDHAASDIGSVTIVRQVKHVFLNFGFEAK